ncbi:MAG: zf-HC2 domain-containing protein [Candidatus Hydrogenedentes bacterium]|nr:zf-HC2 domain-containing protein [Candidatus Hydrogenedentota bacterium]
MWCAELRERFLDYLDDDVSFRERVAIEVHLRRCVACRCEMAAMRLAVDACRDTLRHPNPTDRFESLMDMIHRRESKVHLAKRVRVKRPRLVLSRLAVAAALLIGVASSMPLVRHAKRFTEGVRESTAAVDVIPDEAPVIAMSFVHRKADVNKAYRQAIGEPGPGEDTVHDDRIV